MGIYIVTDVGVGIPMLPSQRGNLNWPIIDVLLILALTITFAL